MRLPVLQKIPALQPTELSDVTQRAVEGLQFHDGFVL